LFNIFDSKISSSFKSAFESNLILLIAEN